VSTRGCTHGEGLLASLLDNVVSFPRKSSHVSAGSMVESVRPLLWECSRQQCGRI
jgi:hypothetical protein